MTVGPYLPIGDAERIELPRPVLPRSLSCGESAQIEIRIPLAAVEGRRELTIDLVREGLAWFEDYGSAPLVGPLPS